MTQDSIINDHSNSGNSIRRKGITFLLLLALILESYFLIYDIPIFKFLAFQSPSQNDAPVARLTNYKNSVHHRHANDIIWEETPTDQLLRSKDSLLTSEHSQAEIAFLDGIGVVLGENSLIQIEQNPAATHGQYNLTIKLLRGSLHKRKTHTSFTLPPSEYPKIQPPLEFQIQVGDIITHSSPDSDLTLVAGQETDHDTEIRVEKGEVQIQNRQNQFTLKKNETAVIPKKSSSSPLPRPQAVAFHLLFPTNGTPIKGEDRRSTISVDFRWVINQFVVPEDDLILEVSKSSDFDSNVKTLMINKKYSQNDHLETQMELPLGNSPVTWFWRVRSGNNSHLTSRVEKFSIEPKFKPVLIQEIPGPPPPSQLFTPEVQVQPKSERNH
jgi:hypothetical protein